MTRMLTQAERERLSGEITREQAIGWVQSGWWRDVPPREAAQIQLGQPRLCMDLADFQDAVAIALEREVSIDELAYASVLSEEMTLRDLALRLRSHLAELPVGEEGFARIATAGEPVRRVADRIACLRMAALPQCAMLPTDVEQILVDYELALLGFSSPPMTTEHLGELLGVAENLAQRIVAHCASLATRATRSDGGTNRGADDDGDAEARRQDDALFQILDLEAICAIVCAAERAGRVPDGTVIALGARLSGALAPCGLQMPPLAQLARDRWRSFGDDPWATGAYAWLEALAEAAVPVGGDEREDPRS